MEPKRVKKESRIDITYVTLFHPFLFTLTKNFKKHYWMNSLIITNAKNVLDKLYDVHKSNVITTIHKCISN